MMNIYNGWAFSENEEVKGQSNRIAYQALDKSKFKILQEIPEYNHNLYEIEAFKPFTGAEMLLFADKGNLCFGGFFEGHDDITKTNKPGVYTCTIFTD